MAKITVALLRDLENQCDKGEISFSRMVELLNERAAEFDTPADPIPWPEEAKWENAPEGTFARAVDESGQCCFYIMQQSCTNSPGNVWAGGYKYCGKIPDMTGIDWKQTLQFKPNQK